MSALVDRLIAARDRLRSVAAYAGGEFCPMREAREVMADAANALVNYDKTMQRIAAEPAHQPSRANTIEVGGPMPYFCPACQAIPQAGYCKLTGCPTAPSRPSGDVAADELIERLTKVAYGTTFLDVRADILALIEREHRGRLDQIAVCELLAKARAERDAALSQPSQTSGEDAKLGRLLLAANAALGYFDALVEEPHHPGEAKILDDLNSAVATFSDQPRILAALSAQPTPIQAGGDDIEFHPNPVTLPAKAEAGGDVAGALERLRRDLELQDGGGVAYSALDADLYTVVVQGEDLRQALAALAVGKGSEGLSPACTVRDATPQEVRPDGSSQAGGAA